MEAELPLWSALIFSCYIMIKIILV